MIMMKRMLVIAATFAAVVSPLQAGVWDSLSSLFRKDESIQTPAIRVLVDIDRESLHVVVEGPFKGYDPRTGELLLVSKMGKNMEMQVIDGGLKWGEEFPGVHQLLIVPTNKTTHLYVDGVEYPGSLYFYDVERKLSVVNKVPLEQYLAAVLTPAYHSEEPEELLSAIAITARTSAYYLAENPKNPYWAVDAHKVGYRGLPDTETAPAINRAIRETRHMILSKTGAYEGVITPFVGEWQKESGKEAAKSISNFSKITLKEAKTMAETGANAAQILSKAFPNSSIQVASHMPGTVR